jgi:hypothetical protein
MIARKVSFFHVSEKDYVTYELECFKGINVG